MSNDKHYEQLLDKYKGGRDAYSLQEKLIKEKSVIALKAELFERFQNTEFKDEEQRTEIWRKMQVINWFDEILTQIINDGKFAEDELKGFAKFKQFFKG